VSPRCLTRRSAEASADSKTELLLSSVGNGTVLLHGPRRAARRIIPSCMHGSLQHAACCIVGEEPSAAACMQAWFAVTATLRVACCPPEVQFSKIMFAITGQQPAQPAAARRHAHLCGTWR
jgi:stage III sporulation protein SpoIIIAA